MKLYVVMYKNKPKKPENVFAFSALGFTYFAFNYGTWGYYKKKDAKEMLLHYPKEIREQLEIITFEAKEKGKGCLSIMR